MASSPAKHEVKRRSNRLLRSREPPTDVLDTVKELPVAAKRQKKSSNDIVATEKPYDPPELSQLPPPDISKDACGRRAPTSSIVQELHAGTELEMQLPYGPSNMRLRIEGLLAHEHYSLLYRVQTINPSGNFYTLRILLSAADVGLQGPQALVYDFEMSGACLEEHGTLQKLKESPHKAHVATSHGYGKVLGRHAMLLSDSQATLRQLVAQQRGLPESVARKLLVQIVRGALLAPSSISINHRNLCLGNILLSPQPPTPCPEADSCTAQGADGAATSPSAPMAPPTADTDNAGPTALSSAGIDKTAKTGTPASDPAPPLPHVMVLGFAANSCYQGANGQPAAKSKAAPYSRNAPEVDAGLSYLQASDVYALGMLHLEVLTGQDPFAYMMEQAVASVKENSRQPKGLGLQGSDSSSFAVNQCYHAQKAAAGKDLLGSPDSPFSGISNAAKAFLREVLSESADSRPSAYNLPKHAYLSNL